MKKNKPARWAYLDELDGLSADDTPIREQRRNPSPWEILLYASAAVLWAWVPYALIAEKVGATGCLLLGGSMLLMRVLLYEVIRRSRCKSSVLGTVESFTRPRRFRKNARYPVIRFEADGKTYLVHGAKPVHPSTKGNEEWVRYNPASPANSFVTSDSKPLPLLLLTAATAILGVAFLIFEMS